MAGAEEETTLGAADLQALRERLAGLDTAQLVTELERMDATRRAIAFRLLSKREALEVFEDLDPSLQREILDELREEATGDLIADLDPDDRARLFDELPAGLVSRLLSGLDPAERAMTTTLLGYPEGSVGRRMTPEVAALPRDATASDAIARLTAYGEDVETIYSVPVVADGRRVVGVVSLRRLLLSDPDVRVDEVMSDPVMVEATDGQEQAARVVREGGFIAVPVVDHESRLLGVFTVDDAMRVLEAEEDEDVARGGASEPLRRPYLTVSLFGLVRTRVVWLLVLILAATLTVGVQSHFEDELDAVVSLALFIPLLIGTGGNAGAQAATTVVRAMALDDVRPGDLFRVVGREILVGALLGATLAAVGFLPATWVAGADIATVLAATVVAVCALATTVGSSVPLTARKLGIDPAIVSAPFISTFVDTLGLVIYFSVAKAVLGI
ncbi:magnesium transporter [Georgenia deserti]|uniref:Magnesium transporter MgtE n=1 Tax=Georgenia deserti TaxID=2093781 RepID=A0ABW4L8N6_9MICO